MPGPAPSLRQLITRVDDASDARHVSVGEILDALGTRSFAPAVIVPSMILVSPVSGIPGLPTIGAILICLITVQWLFNADHLWLPDWILSRRIRNMRLHNGLMKIAGLADWVDDHSGRRLQWLTRGPVRKAVLASIILVAASWPFLELLPMVTSVGATAVVLWSFGLWVRDGLFVLGGYAIAGALIIGLTQLAGAIL